jgi:hypothetical protein
MVATMVLFCVCASFFSVRQMLYAAAESRPGEFIKGHVNQNCVRNPRNDLYSIRVFNTYKIMDATI